MASDPEEAKLTDTEKYSSLWAAVQKSQKADRAYFSTMQQARKFFKGLQAKASRGVLAANLTMGAIQSLQANLFIQSPRVTVLSPTPELEGKEKIWQSLINVVLPKMNTAEEVSKIVLDSLLFAEGWAKISAFKGDEEDTTEGVSGYGSWKDRSGARWHREAPYRVVVDHLSPGRDIEQARFIAVRYVKDTEELKDDDRYTFTGDHDPEGVVGSDFEEERLDNLADLNFEDSVVGADTTTIYEVWVYKWARNGLRKVVLVFTDQGEVIRGPIGWAEFLGDSFAGWPFERLVFNDVPDSLPMSDVDSWKVLQKALNYVLSKIVHFLRKQKTVFTINPDRVNNPSNVRKMLLSDRAIEVVEASEDNAVGVFNTAPIPTDLFNLINQVLSLWDRTASVSSLASGSVRNIRTASEVAKVGEAGDAKASRRVMVMQNFLTRMVEKWCMLTMHTITGEQVIRLTGNPGTVEWARFDHEDIQWLPGIEIIPESFQKTQQQQDIQKWTTALQMVLKAVAVTGPSSRVDLILAEALRALGIPGVSEIVGSPQQSSMMQMAEITQLALGVPVAVSPNDDDQTHLGVIAQFKNSPAWSTLEFEGQQAVQAHEQEHIKALQEKQAVQGGGATVAGESNPMVGLNQGDNLRQSSGNARAFGDLTNGQGGGL